MVDETLVVVEDVLDDEDEDEDAARLMVIKLMDGSF
jgi:hypothetical protein